MKLAVTGANGGIGFGTLGLAISGSENCYGVIGESAFIEEASPEDLRRIRAIMEQRMHVTLEVPEDLAPLLGRDAAGLRRV